MVIYDKETLVIVKANEAFHEKYRYTKAEVTKGSVSIKSLWIEKGSEEPKEDIKLKSNKREASKDPVLHFSKTGEKFYVHIESQPYTFEGEAACLVVIQDLTKRIEAEKKSLQSYAELQQHIANSPLASVRLDNKLRIEEWSKRAREILGYDEADVLGRKLLSTIIPKKKYRKKVKRKIQKLLGGNDKRDVIETEVITKGGDVGFVRIHISIQREQNGALKSAVTLIENLSHQKRVETHYERLFRFARDGIYLLNQKGRLVDCNPRAAEQLQVAANDLIGQKIIQYAPEYQPDGTASRAKAKAMTKKAFQEGFSIFEWTVETPAGNRKVVEISLNSIQFPDGRYIHAIAREIDDKKEIQNKLRRSEELFRNLFLELPAALVMIDMDENVTAVNESFIDMFGYRYEEAEGEPIDDLIVPSELRGDNPKISEGEFALKEFNFETVRITKEGQRKHVIAAGIPVLVDEKLVAGFGMYVDITDRKMYEDELNKSVKEKQVMLEEIHHRVKNNLAVISGILQLQAFESNDMIVRKALNNSQQRIKSIALVHEMLYETENFIDISIKSYLQQLLEYIQQSLPSKSQEIAVNIDSDEVEMTMKQAVPTALLVNELVTNVYKHAFDKTEKGVIDISVTERKNDYFLKVADNGKGLNKDFEFEESKSLGLSLIKTLAKQLKADTSYSNDNGAVFQFCIPKDE